MAINLTPEEEQQIEDVKESLQGKVEDGDTILDLIDQTEEVLLKEDEVYELYQDNANDIRDRYELERLYINGVERSDDISQADFNQWLSHQGRLHGNDNTLLIQEPIRIDAFDFPPNPIQRDEWELSNSSREDEIKAIVQATALGGNNTDMGLFDSIDDTTSSFRMEPNSGFVSGDYGVVDTGSDFGIFKVVNRSYIEGQSGDPLAEPPIPEVEEADLIEIVWLDDINLPSGVMPQDTYSLKPEGTISGSFSTPPLVIKGGVSFGDTERINQSHPRANFSFQNFLNYIRASWNYRYYYAQNQLMEFNANLHDFLDEDYKINKLEPFVSYIQGLINDDIFSDSVLNPFWIELTDRDSDANARVTEITNQLEGDVYDKFYQFHVFRLNKIGGPFYKIDKLDQTRSMITEQQNRDNLALNSI